MHLQYTLHIMIQVYNNKVHYSLGNEKECSQSSCKPRSNLLKKVF